MTIGQLKKLIVNIPDDVRIYNSGVGDHEAWELSFTDGFVLDYQNGSAYCREYFGDEYIAENESKIRALITLP